MSYSLKRVTPPAVEPLTLAEAKAHLRVDIADDDALIGSLISAARMKCEDHVARSYVTTTWRLMLDTFPVPTLNANVGDASLGWALLSYTPERVYPSTAEPIRLPRADVLAVTGLTYVDSTGTTQTLAPSEYVVQDGAPGMVYPAYGKTWPAARRQPGAVQVTFTAGYGPDASTVPDTVKAAMRLLIGLMYEKREEIDDLPQFIQWILAGEDWGVYT